MADCDVCVVGKRHPLAHPKTVDHKVTLPFQFVSADLMGFLTPEAFGGHKYITKISDEYTKWTAPYLLKSNLDALSSFQVFVEYVVTPSDFCVRRLRVDKGSEFISTEFQDYSIHTGVSLEYASTNTPQQIAVSERVRRMFAHGAVYACRQRTAKVSVGRFDVHGGASGQQGAAIGDRRAVSVQSATRNGAGPLTSSTHQCRVFVYMETYFKTLELTAVEGRLVGYSNSSKSYRVYNSATRRVVESRNVFLIETPSRLFSPPLEVTSREANPPRNGMDDYTYVTDDDFLRDLRDYTSVLEPLPVLLLTTSPWAGSETIHRWTNSLS